MKFVHFWDDNIVAPVVVVATTAVATVGTLFLGIGHPVPSAAPNPVSVEPYAMTLVSTAGSPYAGSDTATVSEDLCERVITKEDDIDHMNAEIDALMAKVKQRARKSSGASTKQPR